MKKNTTLSPTGLTMRWVPVQQADGRVRMEIRWSAPAVIRKASAA
jgi:hypothetical protein